MKENQVSEEVLLASEHLTAIWISAYLDEIERIEHFFTSKLDELVNHFIKMQDKFRLKSEFYETAETEKQKKKAKKEKALK